MDSQKNYYESLVENEEFTISQFLVVNELIEDNCRLIEENEILRKYVKELKTKNEKMQTDNILFD